MPDEPDDVPASDDAADELGRVRAESIARLERGGLPVEAERRLQELRGRSDFFTSDLTVAEFALGAEHGLRPISQVMGSCVYRAAPWFTAARGSVPGDVWRAPTIAKPWNEARRIALRRLSLEATECGADAVIGVRLSATNREFAESSLEFQALGTAIRITGAGHSGRPALCALSGQDYWRLHRAGCRIAGIVAATEVVAAIPDVATQRGQAYGSLSRAGYEGREVEAFSRATQLAVAGAMAELERQARAVNASGVVGVTVDHEHSMIKRANPGIGARAAPKGTTAYGVYVPNRDVREPGTPAHREDLVVTAHALGTAVIEGPAPRHEAGLTIKPVRRLDADRRKS